MKRRSKTLVVQPQLGIRLHAIAEKIPEKKETLLARPRSQWHKGFVEISPLIKPL
jgi:hypothetical protein